jgi:N-terminal acetyltransferase B complex catalytic subunit
MGKVEGAKDDDEKKNWHGHVTAVTVAPAFRRQGLARSLMDYLEEVTNKRHNGFFVDLFVRPSNKVAITMYEQLGYLVYRSVTDYYSGGADNDTEDAYDMRKSMARDKDKITMKPLNKAI